MKFGVTHLWHHAGMLFGDVALARRIEQAECGMLIELTETARRLGVEDALVAPVAGGVATYAGEGAPMNKLAGLGFDGPVDEAALETIEREFDQRKTPLQVELPSLAELSIATMLTRRGYIITAFEDVLGLRLDAGTASPPVSGIVVREATMDETRMWMDTVVTGFEHPDAVGAHEVFPREVMERIFGVLEHARTFRRYLALRDGEIAGAASLRMADGIAQLAGAATLPAHRRRGVQSALLRARLAAAAAQGCDVAVVVTQPGSKSEENSRKHCFDILYTRVHLRRDPPVDSL